MCTPKCGHNHEVNPMSKGFICATGSVFTISSVLHFIPYKTLRRTKELRLSCLVTCLKYENVKRQGFQL